MYNLNLTMCKPAKNNNKKCKKMKMKIMIFIDIFNLLKDAQGSWEHICGNLGNTFV